ncbi:MAG TPA: protein-L-isoaspartate(D-aspartate) O-methyltransferase [Spirochaetota bacterium]|nr:protein-L-isoaspartate(D-aspartate) O-methyltransferase [Spirochaetota bacterium]HPI90133.1 protein-L-isoaspartate(D-aspartate) O-methyltransferase [Spirochaetota bacterium]HPR49151.1 protein-L-isoaspartate(D-aspartate) O-methyltransferase [Spirochaetota bacterium]
MERLREQMVTNQISARGVTDERVLKAMSTVERHRFVPSYEISEAYNDHPLPIGHGQTISQPYIVALMSELCELRGKEKVLEIGTGSGYQAAVLSLLADKVFTIEIIESLGKSAEARLRELGYDNVHVRIGDGYKGWPEEAPFDRIILTASPPQIPQSLIDQLADGGILVSPEGEFMQELVRIKKSGKSVIKESVTYVRFVPMVHGR